MQDGQKAMKSLARVKTTLKEGAQAKVTLEATILGMSGKHYKATLQVSGASTSKVVVSAVGPPKQIYLKEGRPSAADHKGATPSTVLLTGPNP